MRTVLLLSGGVDSTVLAYRMAEQQSQRVHAISFRYGQRNADREISCAARTAARLHMRHSVVPLSPNCFGQSALTGYGQVPAVPVTDVKGTAPVIVPARNLIFLAMAASVAAGTGVPAVYFAAHKDDVAAFPDCRPEFVKQLNTVLRLGGTEVTVMPMWADRTKAQVVEEGARLFVNWRDAYSCYEGGALHCGKCGACRARAEAFTVAGVEDTADHKYPAAV